MKTIMKRAWEIYKTLVGDHIAKLSLALKMAWAEVKTPTAKKITFTGKAKTLKTVTENDESSYLYFNKWEKYGKVRIYINDYKNRTLGYIENGEVLIKDRQGNYQHEIETAIANFDATYTY